MIPDKFRVLGPDGNGGTILDARSPYTYMERSIYQKVSEAFESQMGRYARAPDISVLGSCFQLIPNEVSLYYPPLTLMFEGGAKMELSWIHYLLLDDRSNSVYLSFITDNVGGVVLNVGLSGGHR
uniref:Xylanase inhibitor C-terminal domain-containing protein n=1 Tax=Quercus lobata TaxID=97700 RepID=A0A7N2R849_QUELO